MLRFLLVYLALVNLLTYGVYWLDKRRARTGGRRISERELLVWALIGGTPAAWYAMRRFRHKTRKRSFQAMLLGVAIVQVGAIWWMTRS